VTASTVTLYKTVHVIENAEVKTALNVNNGIYSETGTFSIISAIHAVPISSLKSYTEIQHN